MLRSSPACRCPRGRGRYAAIDRIRVCRVRSVGVPSGVVATPLPSARAPSPVRPSGGARAPRIMSGSPGRSRAARSRPPVGGGAATATDSDGGGGRDLGPVRLLRPAETSSGAVLRTLAAGVAGGVPGGAGEGVPGESGGEEGKGRRACGACTAGTFRGPLAAGTLFRRNRRVSKEWTLHGRPEGVDRYGERASFPRGPGLWEGAVGLRGPETAGKA
ncbi:hypothetical protein GCM10010273_02030 [Streptomyces lavendulocolor]